MLPHALWGVYLIQMITVLFLSDLGKMKTLITSAFLPNNSVDLIIKERIDATVMEFSKLIEMCLQFSSMEPTNTQSKST